MNECVSNYALWLLITSGLCFLAGMGVGYAIRHLRCSCGGDLDPATIRRLRALKNQIDGIDPIGKESKEHGKRNDR